MPMMWKRLLDTLSQLGVAATDSDEVRFDNNVLVGSYIVSASTASVYGIIYLTQGEVFAGSLFIVAVIIATIFFVNLVRTRKNYQFKLVMFTIYLLIPTAVTWVLGGFNHSSIIMIWSFLSPILALMTSTARNAARWLYAYLALFVITAIIQPFLPHAALLPVGLITRLLVINLGLTSIIIFMVLRYFINQKNIAYALLALEEEKSNNLLLNMLPKEIADTLKEKDQTIANHFEAASILFADLVGFTPLSAKMEPVAMVELLNEIFSRFDELTGKYALEKIRTIGDNYMVAAGVPVSRDDHAQALAELALDMRFYINSMQGKMNNSIDFRIGINSGPLIAGVIGKKKFQYDVWGDTVNIASRMESHGLAGKIQVTSATYELLKDKYLFERRGMLEIKGKGEMETWFLEGRQ